jgi:hypothetical protein
MSASGDDALSGCLEVCRRCRELVTAVCDADTGGTAYLHLGPHLRHCLDHMTALLRGLNDGIVDYDARDRDPRIERDPDRFLAALDDAQAGLTRLAGHDLSRPVEVLQMPAPDAPVTRVASTLSRELVFLSSHTIHHLALMIQLARSMGLEIPEDLGVAFSTAAHRASVATATG